MKSWLLVGSAASLAGLAVVTSHLAPRPQGEALAVASRARPPVESFPPELGQTVVAPSPVASALPFPAEGAASGGGHGPAFLSPEYLLNLGFSFIVGLAVGYAFKIAFKIALIGGGLLLIALFALQQAELIGINWMGMEAGYDHFTVWFGAYSGALQDFMAKNLSNAAAFGAGLLLGLKI